jgi:hypothetical protein
VNRVVAIFDPFSKQLTAYTPAGKADTSICVVLPVIVAVCNVLPSTSVTLTVPFTLAMLMFRTLVVGLGYTRNADAADCVFRTESDGLL